jgi:hypothetical protein
VSLAPLRMSVPGRSYPLAVLAHLCATTRDSYAPLTADRLAAGLATLGL